MLTDASLFPIYFFDCDMFCEKCAQLRRFKIFSQEIYNKTYSKNEIPPNKPLFCRCEKCDNTAVYATNEFAELQEDATFGLCKIWGKGNLVEGDLVFLENDNVCSVEIINRVSGSLPQVTLRKQNKEKIEIQADFFEYTENNSNILYRLIPQDMQNSRIGDLVYHTSAKITGKVIGLEFNGGQRVVVKFENEEIVKMGVENNRHYLTDEILEQNAMWRCKNLSYFSDVKISSHSKVLNVNCVLPNLKAAHDLENIIFSIPQARCFIMHALMKDSNIDTSVIYKELIKNCVCIYDCHIEYESQEIFITGFYSDKDVPKNVHNVLSKFPIKKISLDLKKRSDIVNCKTINKSDSFIRISKIGEKTHIDGWVKSEGEKRKAKLKAFFCNFSFKIKNHLFVIPHTPYIIPKNLFLLLCFLIGSQTISAANAKSVLQQVYKAEYSKAFSEISKIPKEDSSACVLKGIAFVSRFDDLGDTLDLDSALFALEKCKAGAFWEPLRRYEIGLINSILGNTIKSITETRGAALIFAERDDLDSKAFYAIYGYYAEALTNWIPFFESKRDIYLANLKKGFESSNLFSPVFGNSFIWILYDNKKYSEALEVANSMLALYPEHPVILQTKADIFFKLGRIQEAVSIYKQSEVLYSKRAPNSIRYWCAVANLAKMTKDDFWKEKLQSREYKKIQHWMPEGI